MKSRVESEKDNSETRLKKKKKKQDFIVLRFSVNSFKWSLANLGDPGMYNFIACAIKSP